MEDVAEEIGVVRRRNSMATSTSRYAYIACDATKCIGCQLCEYICSYTKTGEFNTYRSRIRTVRVDEILITAVACRTCEDAPCVIACTRDAMTQDPETGIITRGCGALRWLLLVHRGVRFRRDFDQSGDEDGGNLRPVPGRGRRPAVRAAVSQGRAGIDDPRSTCAESASQVDSRRSTRTSIRLRSD